MRWTRTDENAVRLCATMSALVDLIVGMLVDVLVSLLVPSSCRDGLHWGRDGLVHPDNVIVVGIVGSFLLLILGNFILNWWLVVSLGGGRRSCRRRRRRRGGSGWCA